MFIPLQEVEYIFFFNYICVLMYFHSRSRTILSNIFHVSERKCAFSFHSRAIARTE